MLSSSQKKPRRYGGMTKPKSAFTKPTIKRHARSAIWKSFAEDIIASEDVLFLVPNASVSWTLCCVWRLSQRKYDYTFDLLCSE